MSVSPVIFLFPKVKRAKEVPVTQAIVQEKVFSAILGVVMEQFRESLAGTLWWGAGSPGR